MSSATQLPRPGVEVVQEFASTSPTIVTPTLVPCNIAPFFEVIEALLADGTLNSDAKLNDLYQQLELTVAQSSFPSPRGNIDEVNVTEDSVRTFFEFGGSLIELGRDEAFLINYLDPAVATQAFVLGTQTEALTTGGFDIDARTLLLAFDSHTALPPTVSTLPTSANLTIKFAAATPGGRLTIAEVVDQINAVAPGLASAGGVASDQILLTSTKFGARSSIVVRKGGSANAATDGLGFSAADDEIAVGAGFYAVDDSDGDLLSPRLKVYTGVQQVLLAGPFVPVHAAPDFTTSAIEVGDSLVAEGVNIGAVAIVESDQITMEVEQNIMSHDSPFAPRRVQVFANNLVFPAPASSSVGTQTGTRQVAPATVAYVIPQNPFVGGVGASESISVNVIKAGVALPTETVSSGSLWADLTDAVTGIQSEANLGNISFTAYYSNRWGDEVADALGTHLGLRTLPDNTGSGSGITVTATTIPQDGTNAWDLTGFDFPFAAVGDVGENARYRPGTLAFITGVAAFVGGVPTTVTTLDVTTTIGNDPDPFTPTPPVTESLESINVTVHAADAAGLADLVTEVNGQAIFFEAYRAVDAGGAESATGTWFGIRTKGENFGLVSELTVAVAPPDNTVAAGTYNGTADSDLNAKTFKWSLDLNPKVWEAVFLADEDDGGVSLQQVLNKINAVTPNVAASSPDSPPFLVVSSNKKGVGSEMEVTDGDANLALGFTDDTSVQGAGRPEPDMALDISGNLVIQSQILRDGLTGSPFATGMAPIVVAYKGLRLDLSPDADNPSLLVIDDIDVLQAAADPVSSDNPGSLMTFLSLINAPTVSVAAIGVPEISADAPDGTPLGYAKCFEFLENEEVYALATASQLPTVHQTGLAHVAAMSEPEQKGERLYFFNPTTPDRALPDLVASGTDTNTTATVNELTVDVNVAPALIAAGIDPNQDINPTTGAILNEVYIDLSSDDKQYLVQKVTNGTLVTLRATFATGDGNADAFFSNTDLPVGIISDDWSLFIRGDQLLIPGTTRPDRNRIAETVQGAAQAYGTRRGYYVFPDQVAINVSGLEQVVEGYYATACIVGMVGQQPPQQGFTNFPITGLTRVLGSNDSFTNSQLNVMAAGGVYILVQDAQGAPVICRHQLSTDLASIETRELSITKVVDYTAKFLRGGLRNFIGRSNITQAFLDQLSTVIQGQLDFLTEAGVLIGASINNIIQDADAPDTILVDITLDVPFPANYIRITLVV